MYLDKMQTVLNSKSKFLQGVVETLLKYQITRIKLH